MADLDDRIPIEDALDEARLARSLARLHPTTAEVPPDVDDAIRLAIARVELGPLRRTGWASRRGRVAAAAVLLATSALAVIFARGLSRPAVEDLDRSGRVDILDAFALSRALATTDRPLREPDLNDDGIVDEADVELIASRSVALGGA